MSRGKREQKGQMARRLVIFCIALLTVVTLWALGLKTYAAAHNATVDLSDVLTFVGAAFGGELLMLLAKRIFAKPTETEDE